MPGYKDKTALPNVNGWDQVAARQISWMSMPQMKAADEETVLVEKLRKLQGRGLFTTS